MKLIICVTIGVAAISITSCQNESNTKSTTSTDTIGSIASTSKIIDVPYTIANNYFVKNTVQSIDTAKIDSKEKFENIFGMAATMSKEGKPTEIDFNRQYVIALMQPPTDTATNIIPLSLQKNETNEIVLTYKINKGAKQSYSIVPVLAIILDKINTGNVVLKQQ